MILAPKGEDPKVSPLTDSEKQAIQEAVDKAREKADEVELETLLGKSSTEAENVFEGWIAQSNWNFNEDQFFLS